MENNYFQETSSFLKSIKPNKMVAYAVGSSITHKVIVAIGSTKPTLSKLVFGVRPVVIGYLHLMFLGVISLFIIGYCKMKKFIFTSQYGRVQTSLTNKGSDVSFTLDALSAGTLTATIHLSCGYTEIRTFTISRAAQPPTFTTSTFQGCNGTNISIAPICGAVNYTYTIVGNAGVKFTSNGLQALTSSSTTIATTVSGGASVNTLKAKANYPNSISSIDANATLNVSSGSPAITGTFTNTFDGSSHPLGYYPDITNPACTGYFINTNMQLPGAITSNWTKVSSSYVVNFTQNGNNLSFYLFGSNQYALFQLDASNACGTTSQQFKWLSADCGGGGGCLQFAIFPNPAQGPLKVIVPDIPAPCDGPTPNNSVSKSSLGITQIKVYDQSGTLKAQKTYSKSKQASLDVSSLKAGVYFDIYLMVQLLKGSK